MNVSNYKTIQTENIFLEDSMPTYGFFERYCVQLRDMHHSGLDFITIWYQFCKVNNINPKKPWQLSSNELQNLDKLTDHDIFLFIAKSIGSFWKAGYNGDGF